MAEWRSPADDGSKRFGPAGASSYECLDALLVIGHHDLYGSTTRRRFNPTDASYSAEIHRHGTQALHGPAVRPGKGFFQLGGDGQHRPVGKLAADELHADRQSIAGLRQR